MERAARVGMGERLYPFGRTVKKGGKGGVIIAKERTRLGSQAVKT